jgi:predicted dehydrogenase
MSLGRRMKNVRLETASDIDPAKLNMGTRFLKMPQARLTRDCFEIFSSPSIDAVHICTPNDTHYALTKRALESGKHVLVEKPMSLTTNDALDLADLAESRKLVLQVGSVFRFSNVVRKCRELIRERVLGRPHYLRFRWTDLVSPAPETDILFDLGYHPLDITQYLIGKWPRRVQSTAISYRRDRPEEVAYVIAWYDDKVVSSIELSWLQPGKVREISLVGSQGSCRTDCLNQKLYLWKEGATCSEVRVRKNNVLQDELAYFVNCVSHDNRTSVNDAFTGADCTKVLESMRYSLKVGSATAVRRYYRS